ALSILRVYPISTHFPYTTLFRSSARPILGFPISAVCAVSVADRDRLQRDLHTRGVDYAAVKLAALRVRGEGHSKTDGSTPRKARSEEHTSELQSRRDLVCRLLLE